MPGRVVHLSSVHPPHDTRIFHKECVTLVKAGYDVVLIVPGVDQSLLKGVQLRSVPSPRGRGHRMLHTAKEVIKLGLAEDADIYHLHDPELLIWAYKLRRQKKAIIFDMHENMPGALLTKPWIPSLLRKPFSLLFQQLERLLLKDIPVIFAEKSYTRFYPWIPCSTVVLNLPDVSNMKLDVPVEKFETFSMGYMGVVSEARGSFVMLEATKLLQQKGLQVDFHCVGDSKDHIQQTALQQQINHEGIKGVTLYGRLPQKDGWRVMARCHVGLAVLQPIPNYIESYPTKIFEYMALGLPVIVSDFPLYLKIIDKYGCGIGVSPNNPSQIAEALSFLHDNPNEAAEMGKRGKEAVFEELNWSTEGRKLVDFYHSLLRLGPTVVFSEPFS